MVFVDLKTRATQHTHAHTHSMLLSSAQNQSEQTEPCVCLRLLGRLILSHVAPAAGPASRPCPSMRVCPADKGL